MSNIKTDWHNHAQPKTVVWIFSFCICNLKNKTHDTHDLLLEISLNKEFSIMTDQFPATNPMRTNCKQLQKIGQCSFKCYNYSPTFIINFSRADQKLVPILSCHFFPVRKSSFWKPVNIFKNVFIVNPMDCHSNTKFQKIK